MTTERTAPVPFPAPPVASDELPWVTLDPGFAIKVLKAGSDRDARALLLRVEPGVVVPRHRHRGDVHAFQLSGHRRLDSGESVGPGGYVYEPVGNVDSWTATGDEPSIILVVVRGALEYLDEDGQVRSRTTTSSIGKLYQEAIAGAGR